MKHPKSQTSSEIYVFQQTLKLLGPLPGLSGLSTAKISWQMCLLFKSPVCQSVLLAGINPLGSVLENLPKAGELVLQLDLSVLSVVFFFSLIFSPEKGQGNYNGLKQL